jgi:hypothetical protein
MRNFKMSNGYWSIIQTNDKRVYWQFQFLFGMRFTQANSNQFF